jgi:hypothetical protein
VFIKGVPAARLIERCACDGALDSIAQGAATVFINGLPAARRGDASSHGGAITEGEPSVQIGGPTVTIRVDGDEAFLIDVQRALAKILPTRSGQEWMRRMIASGRTVTIVRSEDDISHCRPDDADDSKNGTGTDSTVQWNPDHDTTDATLPGLEGRPGSAVLLGHELVHALHFAEGHNRNGPKDSYYEIDHANRNEERSTVGTSGPVRQPDGTLEPSPRDYSHDVPTENSFRDDLGIPRRKFYYVNSPFWKGTPPW